MNFLLTGDRGFIGTYIANQLLEDGNVVVGVDNNSKYGPQSKQWDGTKMYIGNDFDVRDEDRLFQLMMENSITHMIMGAAMIGGISYFHKLPYTLLATNEQIMAAQYNAAIRYNEARPGWLKRVVVISSSMVYENAYEFPSFEGDEKIIPPPSSSYGFQKLATEYFARAAYDEFGIPYTIVRPFNCVGVGEIRAKQEHDVMSGNVKLAMSHVVPDLIQKIAKGQNPLHILGDGRQVRYYTWGGDLARGIVEAAFHSAAINNDYNLSTIQATTVLELAQNLWERINGTAPFEYVSDAPFKYDVQMRSPSTIKARSDFGWVATKSLDDILDEVVPWTMQAIENGLI